MPIWNRFRSFSPSKPKLYKCPFHSGTDRTCLYNIEEDKFYCSECDKQGTMEDLMRMKGEK